MRKVLMALLALLLLAGCSSKGRYREINPKEAKEMFDKKESFIMIASKDGCETCSEMKQTVKDLTDDYEVTIYVVNTSNEKYQDEMNSLIYDYLYRLDFTPSLYFVENGKVTYMEENGDDLTSINFLVDLLVEYGYIKNGN